MKKNTGCGSNHHNSCPTDLSCDVVRSKHVNCDVDSFEPCSTLFPRTIKTPVTLAEVILEADVEADITLPTAAREIKQIRKNISLKQCRAIPSFLPPESGEPGFVKLFVTGVIHKNIQYVEDCSGFVRDYSTDVEFSCNQRVQIFEPIEIPANPFLDPPFPGFSVKNSTFERREITPDGMGANRCVGGSLTFESFHEPIHCELLSSAVNELDLFKNFDHWGRFRKITEKIEVLLFFKLLQNQQIAYSAQTTSCPPIVVPENGTGDA